MNPDTKLLMTSAADDMSSSIYMQNIDSKLVINLYSDANFLALNILENLLAKNCLVNIITNDVKKWKDKTVYITNKSHFSISDKSKFDSNQKCNYIVYCGGFIDKSNVYKNLKEFISDPKLVTTKTVALLPFEVFNQNENSELQINDNLSVIYLGDLLGPRIDLESNLLASLSINEILTLRTLTLGIGEVFYPIFVSDAVKTITKWLFSFGPYGKETFLLGSQCSGSTFWQENQKIVTGINLTFDPDIKPRSIPRGYETKIIQSNLRLALLETYRWLSAALAGKPKEIKSVKPIVPKKPRKKIVYPKFLKPTLLTLLLILLFPLLTLAISIGSFFVSFKAFTAKNDSLAQNSILVGKTFSVMTVGESNVLSYIPAAGLLYKEISFTAQVGERLSDIGVNSIPLIRTSSDLLTKILGNDIYDPSIYSQEIKPDIDSIYQNLSLLQIETQTAADKNVHLAKYILEKFNFEKYKNLTSNLDDMSINLSSILGKGQSKNYLILFENNMELRPTGGFIGSYGIVTFDGGRMSDLTINDVYSADGQLNGHVEPPAPIKNYLGEANWWLRDSNWDPDFPTSAQRAEWFLDKEVGRTVDGVIAIDLQPIKDILKFTGPVFLPDFNMSIDTNNLYEKTQSESQDNFFPGTHKKASFLTALSRSLLGEIGKLDASKETQILKSFFSNLEGRHVQVYMHDNILQKDLLSIGWDGSVLTPNCGDNCYPDFVSTVEANLGVNKANYFISRDTKLAVNTSQNEVDKHLTLNLKNSATLGLGPSGTYKTYIRFLVPIDSEVARVQSITGQNVQELTPDVTEVKGRKEVGIWIQVLAGQTVSLVFDWRNNLPQNTKFASYGMYVRKQAGIGDDPFSLTMDGMSVYNTVLTKDISWTKKF